MLSSLRPLNVVRRIRYGLGSYSGQARCIVASKTAHQQPKQTAQANSDNNNNSTKYKPHQIDARFLDDDKRMPPRERLKNLIVVYGPTAIVLHIGLSLSFLGLTYLGVQYGIDVKELMKYFDIMENKYAVILANSGTFGLAYALYKAMMPLRVLVTLFLTPKVARVLQKYGIIKRNF